MFGSLAIAIGELAVNAIASESAPVNFNPIWDGVPTDPIALIPTTSADVDYLSILVFTDA
ncbi:MAG: hypothetical protein E6R03_02625 [Hyphomicrobiaceae bacterium]|nr:MAG: hypothetical protein E6R03_02625 [Hyphomicrobiaceae bacterium]